MLEEKLSPASRATSRIFPYGKETNCPARLGEESGKGGLGGDLSASHYALPPIAPCPSKSWHLTQSHYVEVCLEPVLEETVEEHLPGASVQALGGFLGARQPAEII